MYQLPFDKTEKGESTVQTRMALSLSAGTSDLRSMVSHWLKLAIGCVFPIAIWSAPEIPALAAYDRTTDIHGFTVYLENGGWCWYQDPRAIVSDNNLFIGGVEGNGRGSVVVGIHDLANNVPRGRVVLREDFGRDDHNTAAFFRRSDGRVIAVYARHGDDFLHRFRMSDAGDPLTWSPEEVFVHDYDNAGRITYVNLWGEQSSGLLYNFHRGIAYNPSFIVSADEGLTWKRPTHFIQSELSGRHRPYPRYVLRDSDSLHVSFTDAHPRRFGNSIYHAVYRDGRFWRADGTLIKSLAEAGPLRPSEADLVFEGSGETGRGKELSAPGAAWTTDIAMDADGAPHIAYTYYVSNHDNRFRLAQWNGTTWIDREIAHAGRCLYDREASYTGLLALDPLDPREVFISTDVDPSTGEFRGGYHEIYRARIETTDTIESIVWHPVTQDSSVRNIRPLILRWGDSRVILWNRGDFVTYTDYDLDTVGIIEEVRHVNLP